MASKRIRTQWVLPVEVNPPTDKCFQVNIPNDPYYIAAFKGAMYELAKAYAWADDEAHTAKDVAAVMQERFDAIIEGCDMFDIRIDPENDCMLQKTEDGGETWQDVGSFYPCARGAATDAIEDAIQDGVIGVPGQSGPEGPPLPGVCKTYHVELAGRDQWLCPMPVSAGYTVHVTNAKGGWSANEPGDYIWHCPDGRQYALGACIAPPEYKETDPLPVAPHMQIIGVLPGLYFDPMGETPYEIIPPFENVAFMLQANDDSLVENLGSVSFDVEVCPPGFTHDFNFLLSDCGFTVFGDNRALYVPGQGWTVAVGHEHYIQIDSPGPFDVTTFTRFEAVVTANEETFEVRAPYYYSTSLGACSPAPSCYFDCDHADYHFWLKVESFGHDMTGEFLTHLIVSGQGEDPF